MAELPNWAWGVVAALLLSAVVFLSVKLSKMRSRGLRRVAERQGGEFYEKGSDDAELQFVQDASGELKSKAGVERPPLSWGDVEVVPLFAAETGSSRKQGRMLSNVGDLRRGGSRVTWFDYVYSDTFGTTTASDSEPTISHYSVFRVEGAGALPDWPGWEKQQGGSFVVLATPRRLSVAEFERKLEELLGVLS